MSDPTSEFNALLESAEKRFQGVPGFSRVRRELADDIVVSGQGIKPDDKDRVPSMLLLAGAYALQNRTERTMR